MERYVTIARHPNYEVSDLGHIRNKKTGTVRKLTRRGEYQKVRLNNRDESVHRLVADSFFDGDHTGLQVNHKDGNKENNKLSNLEWVTPSENIKHVYRTGLKRPSGGTPPIGVIDETTGKEYKSMADCARDIGGTKEGVKYALDHGTKYKQHAIRVK